MCWSVCLLVCVCVSWCVCACPGMCARMCECVCCAYHSTSYVVLIELFEAAHSFSCVFVWGVFVLVGHAVVCV